MMCSTSPMVLVRLLAGCAKRRAMFGGNAAAAIPDPSIFRNVRRLECTVTSFREDQSMGEAKSSGALVKAQRLIRNHAATASRSRSRQYVCGLAPFDHAQSGNG